MIKLGHVGVTLICDICGEEIGGFLDFEDAVAHKLTIVPYMRSEGWKSEKYRGEWQDICPECQEQPHRKE